MNKKLYLLLVLFLVIGFSLTNVSNVVSAKKDVVIPIPTTPVSPDIAGGAWKTGSEVQVDLVANPAPTWLQLLSNGVKITKAGEICHPLRGGQFGWVGEIRQLKDGKWVKLATTNGWVPDKEGEYLACAQAPGAGVYALFGYNNTVTDNTPPVKIDPVAYCKSLGSEYFYDSAQNGCVYNVT